MATEQSVLCLLPLGINVAIVGIWVRLLFPYGIQSF